MTIISEKTKASLTIKEWISYTIAIISLTYGFVTYLTNRDNDFNSFKTEIRNDINQVKATQRIQNQSSENQYTLLNNKLDVESNDRKIGQQEIKQEVKETQSLIIRLISKGNLTAN